MPKKRRRKPRVRYDRIAIVGIVLVLIIVLLSILLGSCSDDDVPVSTPEAAVFEPVVYLSPSNQNDNVYGNGETTEAEAMRNVSEKVMEILEQNGVEVHIAAEDDSLQDKVDFANKHKVTAHVAIHSNAGGESGSGEGTECYYNAEISESKILAEYIYNRTSRLTPTPDRGMHNGTTGNSYLFEVANSTVPNCLIEVEFHDTVTLSNWIVTNTDNLAKSIADGIMQYLDYEEEKFYEINTNESSVIDGE